MSLYAISRLITEFAGQGVILPIVVAVAAMLFLAGQRRAALWWAISVMLVLAIALIAKITLIPCGRYWLPGLAVRSPSGHAASAMAVYGGLAVLITRMASTSRLRYAALGLGSVAAVLIAISRIIVGAHSPAEALLGGVIGLVSPLLLLTRRDLLVPPYRLRCIHLLIAPILLVFLFHGLELGAEERIDSVAFQLSFLTGLCR
jgi:membrane-associated phospholipid phosphatase